MLGLPYLEEEGAVYKGGIIYHRKQRIKKAYISTLLLVYTLY